MTARRKACRHRRACSFDLYCDASRGDEPLELIWCPECGAIKSTSIVWRLWRHPKASLRRALRRKQRKEKA